MVSEKKSQVIEDTNSLLEEIKRLSLKYVQNTIDRNAKLEVNVDIKSESVILNLLIYNR